MEKKPSFDYGNYFWKKVRTIMLPYFVATCGYVIFDKGRLDIPYLMEKLLTFSEGSNGHMYYLVFYFQLIMIAPVLVKLYEKCGENQWKQGLFLAGSAILSYLFQRYALFEMFALGGRFLFGGSYFFVFSLGIYFYFHIDLLDRMAAKAAAIVISLMMLGYIVYKEWCFDWWSNPPCIKVIIYTVVIFLLSYSAVTLVQKLLENMETGIIGRGLAETFCLIGRYSLYIYLWHMILVDIVGNMGIYNKMEIAFGEKLLVNCFILYVPCLSYIVYRKGIRTLREHFV